MLYQVERCSDYHVIDMTEIILYFFSVLCKWSRNVIDGYDLPIIYQMKAHCEPLHVGKVGKHVNK